MAQLQPGPCALSLDSGLSTEHSGSRTPILPYSYRHVTMRGPGSSRAAFLPDASDWLVTRSPPPLASSPAASILLHLFTALSMCPLTGLCQC